MMRAVRKFRIFSLIVGALMLSSIIAPICNSQDTVNEETMGVPVGWTEDINLSNDPTYRDNLPQIAIDGNNIHIVWLHNYEDIYYSKSTDCGISWSSPINLFNWFMIFRPLIGVSGNTVHVAWSGREMAGTDRVMYCNSTDSGETWNPPKEIFNATGFEAYCGEIYVNNSNIHIISEDFRNGANGEIYYRRSLDGGITFDDGQGNDWDRRITFGLTIKTSIRINGDSSNISIVWADERDGDWDLFWMISKDNGYTWENGLGTPNVERRLTSTTTDVMDCAIAVNGSNVHISWVEEEWPGPVYNLYYRNSTDNGVSWNNPTLLAGPWAGITNVGIDVDVSNVHLVWGDERIDGEHDEIFYKNSTDGGINWSSDLRLTFNLSTDSFHPKIAVENEMKHIVWYDRFPDNDREIYYKRYPDFPPDPEYNISLTQGWNLMSLPLEQRDESLDQVLQSISGKWDMIQTYDPLSQDHWKSNATFKPDQLNELKTLDHRMGFWIYMNESTNLTVSGPIPTSTTIDLYAGWNLVGYPTLNNTTDVSDALWGTSAIRVEVFNQSAPYLIEEVGPTYIMKPGDGYWIQVPVDTTWTINW